MLGLYKFWNKIPVLMLQYSLFILPIKKKWLYKHNKNEDNLFHSMNLYKNKDFMSLLQYKDSQNLIIFIKDNCGTIESCHNNISRLWTIISEKISELYNPNTLQYYNALNLNRNYWCYSEDILDEIRDGCGNYNSIKRILHDSNPSLTIITTMYVYIISMHVLCFYLTYLDAVHINLVDLSI